MAPVIRPFPGFAVGVDPKEKTVRVSTPQTGEVPLPCDRLVLAAGSPLRMFDILGVVEHIFEVKALAQAAYLRDDVTHQLDRAAATTDEDERARRLCFIEVGGGCAGVETAASLTR